MKKQNVSKILLVMLVTSNYSLFGMAPVSVAVQAALFARAPQLAKQGVTANPSLPFIDWFHVMAYNFTGPEGSGIGLNAPICNSWSSFSIDNVVSDLMKEVPPNKLVLGIPLYGHVFDQTQNKLGSSFVKTGITGSASYEQIKNMYLKGGFCKYRWHEKSEVPSLYCPDEEIFVSFDDERSVQKKVKYAKLKHFKGIMLWKLAGDDKEHSLVRSIAM